jgi:hypothetical protein
MIAFQPNKVPVALRVEDVESARAELESRGVSFKGDTIDVEANEALVRAVFEELHRERPGGFGYATELHHCGPVSAHSDRFA